MAVSSFALADAITGLVTTLQAADGFRDPDADTTDIAVYDGAYAHGGSNGTCLVVGSDGDPNSVQRPARFQTEWRDSDLTMEEVGQIQCAVVVWSGDANPTTFATQRDTALEVLQDADTAIRSTNTAAALGVSQLLWSKLDGAELIQYATDGGTVTRVPFTDGYRAYLTVT